MARAIESVLRDGPGGDDVSAELGATGGGHPQLELRDEGAAGNGVTGVRGACK